MQLKFSSGEGNAVSVQQLQRIPQDKVWSVQVLQRLQRTEDPCSCLMNECNDRGKGDAHDKVAATAPRASAAGPVQ